MAGGQKIDDHKFWAGGKSEGSVFPKGAHTKSQSSPNSAGEENDYEDTSEAIKDTQNEMTRQAKGRPLKPGYRY